MTLVHLFFFYNTQGNSSHEPNADSNSSFHVISTSTPNYLEELNEVFW